MAEAAAIANRNRRIRGDDLDGLERSNNGEGGHHGGADEDNSDLEGSWLPGNGSLPSASKRKAGGSTLRWRRDEALRVERLLGRSQSTLEKKFKQYQVLPISNRRARVTGPDIRL